MDIMIYFYKTESSCGCSKSLGDVVRNVGVIAFEEPPPYEAACKRRPL